MYTNTCKHCHKVFQSKSKTYTCQECKEIDFNQFDDIEAYLKEFPNSNAMQISEALGISAYEVLSFLKEGRLNMTKGIFSRLN
jgi:transposase-like protein